MKLTFKQWKESMSFMLDDTFDQEFLADIKELVTFINNQASSLTTSDGMKRFLKANDEYKKFPPLIRLKALVSLIGLSEERLKRVVTLVRINIFKESFRSEWSVNQISNKAIKDERFLDLLVDFFINARNSSVGQDIPLYYMRNFRLLEDKFITKLVDPDYVERILNDNEILDKYSNRVGAHVEKLITNEIEKYIAKSNKDLTYEVQKEYSLLNKNIDIVIPSLNNPRVLIESSYNITTGSGQSKRADQLVDIYSTLHKNNSNHPNNKVIMINYCDGLGWVGRAKDLERIHNSSDYVLNQKNLHILHDILSEIL